MRTGIGTDPIDETRKRLYRPGRLLRDFSPPAIRRGRKDLDEEHKDNELGDRLDIDETIGPGIARLLEDRDQAPEIEAGEVTRHLREWAAGARGSADELIPLVYRELRRIAERLMAAEKPGTLQPTALVHEAYMRLLDQRRLQAKDRGHFFAITARIMRRVIVDHARARSSWKRGGRQERVPLNEALDAFDRRAGEYVALDDALVDLARREPRRAEIVELRVFGGLTQEETAEVTGLSRRTVTREYQLAKAWLHRRLKAGDGSRS